MAGVIEDSSCRRTTTNIGSVGHGKQNTEAEKKRGPSIWNIIYLVCFFPFFLRLRAPPQVLLDLSGSHKVSPCGSIYRSQSWHVHNGYGLSMNSDKQGERKRGKAVTVALWQTYAVGMNVYISLFFDPSILFTGLHHHRLCCVTALLLFFFVLVASRFNEPSKKYTCKWNN